MSLLVALAVLSVTLRPERTIRTFRIEFPDTAFVVEEDWVMPNERAQNFTEYEVRVPRTRVPEALQALMSAHEVEVREHGASPQQIFNLDVKYSTRRKPGEQFRTLVELQGWKPLPDADSTFRVAVHDELRPDTTRHLEAYEVKADPRAVIFCSVHSPEGDRSEPWRNCELTVTYHAQCAANKCTQIRVSLPASQMNRWAQIAEQVRGVMRPFEVEPDLKHWQERERIHSVPLVPLSDTNSNQAT